jgi:Mg-chelatase subunit ChlD
VARIAVGDSRVFSKTPHKPGIDTAVTIAVDMSGSMRGKRAESALASSLGLAKALHITKGTTARMTIFPGYQCNVQQVVNRGIMPDYSLSGIIPNGGTPLYAAVEDAILELQPLSNNKKVAFVITDGKVSQRETDQATSLATANGVKLHWIAISNDCFPTKENVVHVNDAEELPQALLTQAVGIL